jgi:hypothetical protein
MATDMVMQALSFGTACDSEHALLSNDIVVRFLGELTNLSIEDHYVCLVDISPNFTAMVTTGGNTMHPQTGRKRLRKIHWAIVAELQERLSRPGAFRKAVSGQQKEQGKGKVKPGVSLSSLEQMMNFSASALGCTDALGAVPVNGVYRDIEMESKKLDSPVSMFVGTPQDIIGKEVAIAVDSDLYNNQKFCWRSVGVQL